MPISSSNKQPSDSDGSNTLIMYSTMYIRHGPIFAIFQKNPDRSFCIKKGSKNIFFFLKKVITILRSIF